MRVRQALPFVVAALLAIAAALAPAQAVFDGSFEGQATGPALGLPWTVHPGTNAAVLDGTTPQAFLPSDGGKYLRIDPGTTGSATAGHGPHPAGTVGKVSQTFVIPPHGDIAITLDWEWAPKEALYQTGYDDFLSIDLVDPTTNPPTLIANLLYIDVGATMPAIYHNVPGGGVGLTYVPADLAEPCEGVQAPAGFKRAWTELWGLVAPGQPVSLEISVGNGGDASGDSFALIDNVSLLVAQRNTYGASLRILGSNHLDGLWGADHGDQHYWESPFEIFTLPSQRLAFRASGLYGMPWALFAGELARTGVHFPPIGTVNLTGNLTAVIDGIAPGGGDDFLGTIGPPFLSNPGLSTFNVSANPGTPPETQVAFQGVMIDPGAPVGISLTGATEIRIGGSGVAPRMPSGGLLVTPSNTGGTNFAWGANSDDGATSIDFTSVGFGGGQWMFYPGTFWNEVWVCDNGFLTFGSPNNDYWEFQDGMLTGPPRIAPLWDDFVADGVASTVRFTATPEILTISWNDLSELDGSPLPANNFAVRLYADGQFTFYYGCTTLEDGLVGISPGSLPSAPPGVVLSMDWSEDVMSAGNRLTLPAGLAHFEQFGIFNTPGVGPLLLLDKFDVFTCGHGAARIHFAPTPSGNYSVFTGIR